MKIFEYTVTKIENGFGSKPILSSAPAGQDNIRISEPKEFCEFLSKQKNVAGDIEVQLNYFSLILDQGLKTPNIQFDYCVNFLGNYTYYVEDLLLITIAIDPLTIEPEYILDFLSINPKVIDTYKQYIQAISSDQDLYIDVYQKFLALKEQFPPEVKLLLEIQ